MRLWCGVSYSFFFFFNDTATTEIYTLSLHDALPIYSLDGVTTALELELGTSEVAAWYRERSAGERINYGVSIGHIKVRMSVMHDSGTRMPVSDVAYRAASPAQIGEIAK